MTDKVSDAFKTAIADPAILQKIALQEKETQERIRNFYGSPRFQEILDHIVKEDAVLDDESLAYFPDKHPVTSEEFSLFCHAVFARHEDSLKREPDAKFPTYSLRLSGVEITLLIGQGSAWIAKKATQLAQGHNDELNLKP